MSRQNAYAPGTRVRLYTEFVVDGDLTNPTDAVCEVIDPAGAHTTPTVASVSTGVREAFVTAVLEGDWYYRWTGTGTAEGAAEGRFRVATSPFVPVVP